MIFTNKLAKTLSGLALALAFSNAAHASIVEYNYSFSDTSNNITANFFVDDSINPYDGNITSGSYVVNGASYSFSPSFGGGLWFDEQIDSGYVGYTFFMNTDRIFGLQVDAYSGSASSNQIYFANRIGGGDSYVNTGTLTKVTAPKVKAPNATAVPEPEAYAMMLAGLGLVGFAARRKQAA